MTPHRVALYWAPEVGDPLHALGSRWLGRDAVANAAVAQPDVAEIAEITAEPCVYGLHATLKPPFRLTGAYEAVRDGALAVAARTAPFELPPLSVQDLHGFLALRENYPCPALHLFADDCVEAVDAYRVPPDEAELARRRPERLSEAQRVLLARWGYPYVFEEWRFHVTLTRRLTPEEKARVLPAVTAFLGDAPAQHRRVESLCIFVQAAPGAPFTLAERLPLQG